MDPVSIIEGSSPFLLAQPHSGIWVPDDIASALNDLGKQLLDTDWRIAELYADLVSEATIVRANFSRFVIDANRSPDGKSLYPGQNTTGLVPLTTFDDHPIWSRTPDEAEIERRLTLYHQPYHAALNAQLDRIKAQHGFAVLYDCHSIRSSIPFLFDGSLPDLNIGTNSGASCSPLIEQAVAETCESSENFSSVLNGRFKGGWTTRHYGQPSSGIHAIQMEIAQSAYLESETPPFAFSAEKSAPLRALLSRVFHSIEQTFGDLK